MSEQGRAKGSKAGRSQSQRVLPARGNRSSKTPSWQGVDWSSPIPVRQHSPAWGERELLELYALAGSNKEHDQPNYWIEYFPGDSGVVLAAPHDGLCRPYKLPKRTHGVMVRDTGSKGVAVAIALELCRGGGPRPHLLICHLARTRLDVNRVKEQAAQHPTALRAWERYHELLVQACDVAAHAAPHFALFVDVHAQANYRFSGVDAVELGTLCPSPEDLRLGASHLEHLAAARFAAARCEHPDDDGFEEHLARHFQGLFTMPRLAAAALHHGCTSFADLLLGFESLGGLLNKHNIKAVPSPEFPIPPLGILNKLQEMEMKKKAIEAAALVAKPTETSSRSVSAPPRNWKLIVKQDAAVGLIDDEGDTPGVDDAIGLGSDEEVYNSRSRVSPFFCGSASYTLRAVHVKLDAVQVECPVRITKNPEHWIPLARALVTSLKELWLLHLHHTM